VKDLTDTAILRGLATRHLGRSVEVHQSVSSTNDVALERLAGGSPHGTLVVAEAQTAGRGRRGNVWVTPPGLSLAASLVLRSERVTLQPTLLVAAVALGIAEGLERAAGAAVGIKWPNDLWIGGKKVAGILVEARSSAGAAPALVAGFGINVNASAAAFPPGLRATATSLALATGRTYDRSEVLRLVLASLEPRLDEGMSGTPGRTLLEAYRDRSVLLGRTVELLDGDEPLRGFVADLSATDGLLLRTSDGRARHVRAEHARDVRAV